MEKVNFRENNKKSRINNKKGVPIVAIFHLKLKSLSKIIKNNLYLLYVNDEVKKTFTPSLMISFLSSCKISSYVVRAKLYQLERTVGSYKCDKKLCEVCDVFLGLTHFLALLSVRVLKLIISLIVMINVSCT